MTDARAAALLDLNHIISLAITQATADLPNSADVALACISQARADLLALGCTADELNAAGIKAGDAGWAVVRYDGFIVARSFASEQEAMYYREQLFANEPRTWMRTRLDVQELTV